MKIDGGYLLKPRCIQDSWIAHAAPVIRETWEWLVMNAKYKETKYDSYVLERGQLFCTYLEIREGLSWKVGYRKQMYSENQMKHCMKQLVNQRMITLTKQPRGNVISVCNYELYQNPENYESTTESSNSQPANTPSINDESPSITKESKELKNEKKGTKKSTRVPLDYSSWPEMPSDQIMDDYKKLRKSKRAPITQTVVKSVGKQLTILFNQGISVDQALTIVCERGWQGFKADWVINHLAKNQSTVSNQQSYEEQVRQRDIELGLEPEGNIYEGEARVINGD